MLPLLLPLLLISCDSSAAGPFALQMFNTTTCSGPPFDAPAVDLSACIEHDCLPGFCPRPSVYTSWVKGFVGNNSVV